MRLSVAIRPKDEAERAKATEFAKRVGTHVSSAGEVVFVINGVPLAQLVEVITEAEAYESRAIFYYSA